MSSVFWLRIAAKSAVVLATLFVSYPSCGDHPPLSDDETPAAFDDTLDGVIVGETNFRRGRAVRLDTTLINDVEPPAANVEGESSPFFDNDDKSIPAGPVGTWLPTSDPRQSQCPQPESCQGRCQAFPHFATSQNGASQGQETAVFDPAWFTVPVPQGTKVPVPQGTKVPVPQGTKTGPCGTEFGFYGDAVVGFPPEQAVSGEVLRLFDGPTIHQVAAECGNPQCPFANLTTAAGVCQFCRANCTCTSAAHDKKTHQRTGNVTAILKAKPNRTLQRGEAAEEILNLIDSIGPSVLNGTLFADSADSCRSKHGGKTAANHQQARDFVVQWIRQLEDDDRTTREKPRQLRTENKPKHVKIKHVDARAESVDALRKVARQLDDAAELLEERSLYPRSDQLREIAQQLRHEARGHTVPHARRERPAFRGPTPPMVAPAARDLESELEHIRGQLERVRDALRWHLDETRR